MAKVEYNYPGDWEFDVDRWREQDDAFIELYDEGLKGDTLKGYVWSYPVADGKAQYIVTSLRPLTLTHIPIGDAWTVPEYVIRGLTKADLQDAKDRSKALANLFGRV